MSWTLNNTPVSTLGLSQLRLTTRNLGLDTLTLYDDSRLADADPTYAFGDSVTLRYGSTIRFRGVALGPVRTDDGHAHTIAGPWHYLEEITYEQTWQVADDPDAATPTLIPTSVSRVILHQDDAGAKITVGQQITNILQFAKDAGAPIAIGTIDIPVTIRWEETENRSCAEAIAAALQLIPDAHFWWDYSTALPTAHCKRRSALTSVSIPIDDPFVAKDDGLSIQRLDTLARPAVLLRYRQIHRANSDGWETITNDFYPDPLPADWRYRALVATLELAGSTWSDSYITQRVKTRAIPSEIVFSGSSTDSTAIAFWKRKHPSLDHPDVSIVELRNGTRDQTIANLPNEVEEGAITDWMVDAHNVKTDRQLCTVEITYDVTDGGVTRRHTASLTAHINATNATTRTYSLLENASFTPAEAIPVNLAQTIYDALQGPHHQGHIRVEEDDVSFRLALGQALNITGGESAWSSMLTPVQAVDYDLDTGETRAAFGPPEHNTPQDLITLLRALRDKPAVTSWSRRTTGKTSGGDREQGLPVTFPDQSASSTPHSMEPRRYIAEVTPASSSGVPTLAELRTAVGTVYETITPKGTDKVLIREGDQAKIVYTIYDTTSMPTGATQNALTFLFYIDGRYWLAEGEQKGAW